MTPGLLLAGGRSSRMGENKALLPFGKARLIDHVSARLSAQCSPVWINTNEALPEAAGLPQITDDLHGHQGPLAGIAAGLAYAGTNAPTATRVLSVAVDTPFFPANLAAALEAALSREDEIAVATDADGNWHPTFALWPVSLVVDLANWLGDPDNRRVRAFIQRHPHVCVPFAPAVSRLPSGGSRSIDPFFNINRREDYEFALGILDETA